jgi:hypothetical protein
LKKTITTSDPPLSESDVFTASSGCTTLLGCERDLTVEVFSGSRRRKFNADVYSTSSVPGGPPGELYITTQSYTTSRTNITYNGFTTVDLTAGGDGYRIRITGGSDSGGEVDIELTDSYDVMCTAPIYMPPYSSGITSVARSFDAFDGNCDLTDIAQVRFIYNCEFGLDYDVQEITVVGPAP